MRVRVVTGFGYAGRALEPDEVVDLPDTLARVKLRLGAVVPEPERALESEGRVSVRDPIPANRDPRVRRTRGA